MLSFELATVKVLELFYKDEPVAAFGMLNRLGKATIVAKND